MKILGQSLELFFVDGRPDGMVTAEVFNWTGHVLRFKRTQLADALRTRVETGYTGVYLLLGDIDGDPTIYIGEAETLGQRLKSHAANKDWWDDAVLITSSADRLHKAHVKYLEAQLVDKANTSGRIRLENGNTPTPSSLSEAAIASMESFLETLMLVLPALRIDAFQDLKRDVSTAQVPAATLFDETQWEFTIARDKVAAKASLRDGEWVLLAGSKTRPKWRSPDTRNTGYAGLHRDLITQGVIFVDADHEYGTVIKDYAFSSPSAAAAIVAGRSANGRTSWKNTQTGQSYADWEAQQIAQVALDFSG